MIRRVRGIDVELLRAVRHGEHEPGHLRRRGGRPVRGYALRPAAAAKGRLRILSHAPPIPRMLGLGYARESSATRCPRPSSAQRPSYDISRRYSPPAGRHGDPSFVRCSMQDSAQDTRRVYRPARSRVPTKAWPTASATEAKRGTAPILPPTSAVPARAVSLLGPSQWRRCRLRCALRPRRSRPRPPDRRSRLSARLR